LQLKGRPFKSCWLKEDEEGVMDKLRRKIRRSSIESGKISQLAEAVLIEPNVFCETYQIRSYEVDCRNRLSVLSMFSFMQEAAGKHAAALGVSIHQLISENFTWLLSRLKIKIHSYPGWNDRIRVITWPSGTQQLFALRDFEIKDSQDRIIAAAVSAWLVIDLKRRRPVRISPFIERLRPIEGSHTLPDKLDKLAALRHHDYERNFVVRYSDLDINQHANNVRFVEWVLEGVPAAVLKTSVPAEIEIDFLAEAFYNDQIQAVCHAFDPDNTKFHHGLIRPQDGRELVRAKTRWRKVD
jgi:medium-chain acyl-[acyl-carrier-protein] hydrolase